MTNGHFDELFERLGDDRKRPKLSEVEIKALSYQDCHSIVVWPPENGTEPSATVWYNIETGKVYGVRSGNPANDNPSINHQLIKSAKVRFDNENRCAKGELFEPDNNKQDCVLELVLRKLEIYRSLKILTKWQEATERNGVRIL